jgi:hypothetical protein
MLRWICWNYILDRYSLLLEPVKLKVWQADVYQIGSRQMLQRAKSTGSLQLFGASRLRASFKPCHILKKLVYGTYRWRGENWTHYSDIWNLPPLKWEPAVFPWKKGQRFGGESVPQYRAENNPSFLGWRKIIPFLRWGLRNHNENFGWRNEKYCVDLKCTIS